MFVEENEFIVRGPHCPEISGSSLGKYIKDILEKRNYNKTFLVDVHSNKTITYGQLLEHSIVLADFLRKLNYGKGSIFSISSENNLFFYVPVLASFFMGSVLAPLNPNYTASELRHTLNISKPSIVFCSQKSAPKFAQMQNELHFIKKIIIIDTKNNSKNMWSLGDILKSNNSVNLKEFIPLDGDPANIPALIMCSSGTTGLPKGVLLSQKNIMFSLFLANDERYSTLTENDCVLGIMPFFHAFGLNAGFMAIVMGFTMIMFRYFEEDLFLKSIQDYKINILWLAPPLAVFLAKSPKVLNYDLSSVQTVKCGGAPLKKVIENELKQRLKLIHIKQAYGMTETTLTITTFLPNEYKEGSVGTLVPGMVCKIRDPEMGKSLGPNKVGEICVKGINVMMGYYNNDEATRGAFTSDGFLRTGDIGYYDEEGFFFIVDRLKELIKYKGYQVAPAELESIIINHPKVLDVGVVGLPDDLCGELPLAFVVPYPNKTVTEKEIQDFVKGKVSSQKQLRGGVRFLQAIPKNPSGKILRKELRKILEKQTSKL